MQKIISTFSFLLIGCMPAMSQKISAPLNFQQGDSIAVSVKINQVVAQQAMGQAIDFHVNGSADHFYKVSNSTSDNTTLHHKVKRLQFDFDGMGQKRAIDSDNKKDMDGQLGKPVKDMLSKEFDLIIDPSGKALLVRPEKVALEQPDARFALIANMLKDLISVVYPPQKGTSSFFKVLPAEGAAVGETWQETFKTETESGISNYRLTAATDTTLIVDYKTAASSTTTTEMMGMETSTTMKTNITGQIIIDRVSGIIRKKTSNIESNGATEAMGNSMPINAKATISIVVKKFNLE